MTCTNCEKQISDKFGFCQFCGKATATAVPKTQPAIPEANKSLSFISVGELVTKTWGVFSKVWVTALIVALIGILIQAVVKKIVFGIWGVYFGLSSIATLGLGGGRYFASNLLFNLAGLIIIWTAFLVIHFWMQTAIIYVIKHQEEKDKAQAVKNALKQSWKAMGPISVISLLTSLFTGIGFIFLIIPGIFLTFMWQYATLSYIIDGKKGMEALSYSWNLVWPKFWGVLGRNLLFGLGIIVISFFFRQGLLSTVKSIVIIPFWTAYSYVLYNNLKERKS